MKRSAAWIRKGCLLIAGILFLVFLYKFNQLDKISLYETGGRSFDKAVVSEVLQDNETSSGTYIGNQIVTLEITSGEWKGTELEATSSSSYLYGTHCRVGTRVIALVSESDGELTASVYSADRDFSIYLMAGIFVFIIVLIGGKKGLYSVVGLGFTLLCIVFLFLPMVYKGTSPIFAAILVVALTTIVTMLLIGGRTKKTVTAIAGTITGVVISAIFAELFGWMSSISGYNVSDIENLIYVQDQTGIRIGELMFAGILIASLGAVMDVAMSIASTIQEIAANNPNLTTKELFASGMNVGRDMMGTMSNTLILAFAGGSINTLVFIYAYDYQYLQVINMYSIGVEMIQGLASSLGVVLTVPAASILAAILETHSFDRKPAR